MIIAFQLILIPRTGDLRCGVCHDTIADGTPCDRCGVVLHHECSLSRCPTLGCLPRPDAEPPSPPPTRPATLLRSELLAVGVVLLTVALLAAVPSWTPAGRTPQGTERTARPGNLPPGTVPDAPPPGCPDGLVANDGEPVGDAVHYSREVREAIYAVAYEGRWELRVGTPRGPGFDRNEYGPLWSR